MITYSDEVQTLYADRLEELFKAVEVEIKRAFLQPIGDGSMTVFGLDGEVEGHPLIIVGLGPGDVLVDVAVWEDEVLDTGPFEGQTLSYPWAKSLRGRQPT